MISKDPSILKSMGTRKFINEDSQKCYLEHEIFKPNDLADAIFALTDLVVRHYPEEENHPDLNNDYWKPSNPNISGDVAMWGEDIDMLFGILKDGVRMYEARYGEIASCPAVHKTVQEIRKKFAKKIGDLKYGE